MIKHLSKFVKIKIFLPILLGVFVSLFLFLIQLSGPKKAWADNSITSACTPAGSHVQVDGHWCKNHKCSCPNGGDPCICSTSQAGCGPTFPNNNAFCQNLDLGQCFNGCGVYNLSNPVVVSGSCAGVTAAACNVTLHWAYGDNVQAPGIQIQYSVDNGPWSNVGLLDSASDDTSWHYDDHDHGGSDFFLNCGHNYKFGMHTNDAWFGNVSGAMIYQTGTVPGPTCPAPQQQYYFCDTSTSTYSCQQTQSSFSDIASCQVALAARGNTTGDCYSTQGACSSVCKPPPSCKITNFEVAGSTGSCNFSGIRYQENNWWTGNAGNYIYISAPDDTFPGSYNVPISHQNTSFTVSNLSPGLHNYNVGCSRCFSFGGGVDFWCQMTGYAGWQTCTVPQPLPTCSISASPSTIAYNSSSNISWASTNATSCSLSPTIPGWNGAPSGNNQSTGNLTSATTYNLSCSGPGGTSNNCSTTTVTVNPPTCNINISPSPVNVIVGKTYSPVYGIVSNISSGVSVNNVTWNSNNSSIATVDSPGTPTTVHGQNVGSTTIRATASLNPSGSCTTDGANGNGGDATVNVGPPGPWWQVKDSDVITNGSLKSSIPSLGVYFGLAGAGGFTGVPSYGSAGTATFGSGAVSASPAWLSQSDTNIKKIYNYAFFKSQIPSTTSISEINSTSVSSLAGATPDSKGYEWYHFNGNSGALSGQDLTVSSNISLASRKVILLVEGADLNLNGKVNLTKGSGFFMVVAGKNSSNQKGNISVGASVSGTSGAPALEGIYFSEGQFKTGAGFSQFYVRGSVVAYDGVLFQRDLGSTNSTTPGEVFEYAPDLMLLYPNTLTNRTIRWKEVAP